MTNKSKVVSVRLTIEVLNILERRLDKNHYATMGEYLRHLITYQTLRSHKRGHKSQDLYATTMRTPHGRPKATEPKVQTLSTVR